MIQGTNWLNWNTYWLRGLISVFTGVIVGILYAFWQEGAWIWGTVNGSLLAVMIYVSPRMPGAYRILKAEKLVSLEWLRAHKTHLKAAVAKIAALIPWYVGIGLLVLKVWPDGGMFVVFVGSFTVFLVSNKIFNLDETEAARTFEKFRPTTFYRYTLPDWVMGKVKKMPECALNVAMVLLGLLLWGVYVYYRLDEWRRETDLSTFLRRTIPASKGVFSFLIYGTVVFLAMIVALPIGFGAFGAGLLYLTDYEGAREVVDIIMFDLANQPNYGARMMYLMGMSAFKVLQIVSVTMYGVMFAFTGTHTQKFIRKFVGHSWRSLVIFNPFTLYNPYTGFLLIPILMGYELMRSSEYNLKRLSRLVLRMYVYIHSRGMYLVAVDTALFTMLGYWVMAMYDLSLLVTPLFGVAGACFWYTSYKWWVPILQHSAQTGWLRKWMTAEY